MKTRLHSLAMVMLPFLLVFAACNEDDDTITPNNTNQLVAPLANAGNDTTIYKPFSTTILDGSASTDPDRNITYYQWKLLSGPSNVDISKYEDSKAYVRGLTDVGNYEFELTVTDADRLSSRDTVLVFIVELNCTSANKDIVIKDLSWIDNWWFTGIEIDIFSHLQVNSHVRNIYIKRDLSDDWVHVPYIHDSPEYSDYAWDYLNGKLIIYGPQFAIDDTPDVKIEYCN